MDHFQKFTAEVRSRLFALLVFNNLLLVADWWIADQALKLAGWWLLGALLIVPILSLSILPWLSTRYLVQPTKLIWQAILHIAPNTKSVAAPDMKQAHLGRELVTNLVSHIYQLASVADVVEKTAMAESKDLRSDFIASSLPLPLVVLDREENVLFANQAMATYLQREPTDMVGKNVYSVLDLSFASDHTLDAWLADAKANKVTASQTWERVKLTIPTENESIIKLFDLAVYYNKNNSQGFETMFVLFDHTRAYSQDDQAIGYVALAVHELRTPLTLLRGYIEAFEEELSGKLDPELTGFMRKMQAAAQQLSAFVNNILNVARVEDDQLQMQLHEEKWDDVLKSAVENLRLQAQVRDIELHLEVTPNLPTVAVDRVSIYEVINNLVDNAIKYSGDSKEIIIKSYPTREGEVETTVQDFGMGIPENSMTHIFDKFYRSHRNRAQIGGTGLGLFLSKAIVTAHGGHVWVRSKEGEGSVFGFTVQPYASSLAAARENGDTSNEIVRTAHGWIKNHSLYRR